MEGDARIKCPSVGMTTRTVSRSIHSHRLLTFECFSPEPPDRFAVRLTDMHGTLSKHDMTVWPSRKSVHALTPKQNYMKSDIHSIERYVALFQGVSAQIIPHICVMISERNEILVSAQ